ncbi:hypothetical protein Tco_0490860 [Tanacetum coccineum]
MDNPNLTMGEYIRLEEEKARKHGKVFNWQTATYGKIWDNEDVHGLGSVETEFPAIIFNDTLTSEATLSCDPTDIMDDPNITMEEYIRLEEEKAPKCRKVFNWETTKYGKICSLNNDEIDFRMSFDESDNEDYTDLVKEISLNIGEELYKSGILKYWESLKLQGGQFNHEFLLINATWRIYRQTSEEFSPF